MSDILGNLYQQISTWFPAKQVETVLIKEVGKMNLGAGRNFVRLAGLSGGLAVIMAAYGAHACKSESEEDEKLKKVFESGNKMHIMHSVALLGIPLTRRPVLIGTLMATGLLLFSGTCYYHVITHDARVRKLTPYGGVLLILAWFAMIL